MLANLYNLKKVLFPLYVLSQQENRMTVFLQTHPIIVFYFMAVLIYSQVSPGSFATSHPWKQL